MHHSVSQKDEVYLNLVLDFVPDTVYRVIRQHFKAKQIMPMLYIKVRRSVFRSTDAMLIFSFS